MKWECRTESAFAGYGAITRPPKFHKNETINRAASALTRDFQSSSLPQLTNSYYHEPPKAQEFSQNGRWLMQRRFVTPAYMIARTLLAYGFKLLRMQNLLLIGCGHTFNQVQPTYTSGGIEYKTPLNSFAKSLLNVIILIVQSNVEIKFRRWWVRCGTKNLINPFTPMRQSMECSGIFRPPAIGSTDTVQTRIYAKGCTRFQDR